MDDKFQNKENTASQSTKSPNLFTFFNVMMSNDLDDDSAGLDDIDILVR